MFPGLSSFYADYRLRSGAVLLLHDDRESPPERLLQAIWLHQRLQREALRTLDGEPVRVLHPGFQSLEGGPDFRSAVLQFGDEPPVSGDVEVDLRSSGWHAHGHDRNPAFRNVALHVVWDSDKPAKGTPATLPLRQNLDSPIGELSLWLGGEAAESFPESLQGKCCAPLRRLPEASRAALLHQAAEVRFRGKAAQLQARAREVGSEQALWEGLFRALGYKHNSWPMLRLAELRPRWAPDCAGLLPLQARLFGISGLLPADLAPAQARGDSHIRRTWDQWWRERDEFSDCMLPRNLWRFHGIRPANHPQRRVALASHWLLKNELTGALEHWCVKELPKAALPASLLEVLAAGPDEFWSWHWTFQSARLAKAQPLLGERRVTDLAINVVLPWLWMRAAEEKHEAMRSTVERRYFAWPLAEDNSVLRLARRRLLGTSSPRALPGAAAQQGLIQMVRDFCDHSNSVCEACKLPGLVDEFARSK